MGLVDHLTDEFPYWFALWSIMTCDKYASRVEAYWWAAEPRRAAALIEAALASGLMAWHSDVNDLRRAIHTNVDRATCEAKYTLDTMRYRRLNP
mgnify:CR=1 FL=1